MLGALSSAMLAAIGAVDRYFFFTFRHVSYFAFSVTTLLKLTNTFHFFDFVYNTILNLLFRSPTVLYMPYTFLPCVEHFMM